MIDSPLFPIFVRQGRSRTRFKVGYIDQNGSVAIEPIFDDGSRFYEGLASVRVGNKWGAINSSGEFVIEASGWSWCRFNGAIANVSVNGIWGILDRNGDLILKPKLEHLESFREGRAVFRTGDPLKPGGRHKMRYGFVDTSGIEVIPAVFHDAEGFSEGLAAACVANLWGYIDLSGLFTITPRFERKRQGLGQFDKTRAGYFKDDLAAVWLGDGYGFADRNGEIAIGGAFDKAGDFSEGRALIRRDGRYGFIGKRGDIVIEPRWTFARDFSEGLAIVSEQQPKVGVCPAKGFLDSEGNMVIAPTFYSANSFQNALAFVETEDSIGYINTVGEFVWQGPRVEYGVIL